MDHLAKGVHTAIIADPYRRTELAATPEVPLHELTSPRVVRITIPNGDEALEIDFDALYRQLDTKLR